MLNSSLLPTGGYLISETQLYYGPTVVYHITFPITNFAPEVHADPKLVKEL